MIALIPIVLYLFINGEISKVKIGDLEIEKAFKAAYKSSINEDLTKVEGNVDKLITNEIERVLTDDKGDMDYLRLIKNKNIKALNLKLNYEFYSSWAIQEYVKQLPELQYIVLVDNKGDFYGLLFVDILVNYIESSTYTWHKFKNDLVTNPDSLKKIPGFIDKIYSVNIESSRIFTMELFEKSDYKILPVTDLNKFTGIIERDKLSTKLLINISKKLKID